MEKGRWQPVGGRIQRTVTKGMPHGVGICEGKLWSKQMLKLTATEYMMPSTRPALTALAEWQEKLAIVPLQTVQFGCRTEEGDHSWQAEGRE